MSSATQNIANSNTNPTYVLHELGIGQTRESNGVLLVNLLGMAMKVSEVYREVNSGKGLMQYSAGNSPVLSLSLPSEIHRVQFNVNYFEVEGVTKKALATLLGKDRDKELVPKMTEMAKVINLRG